MSETCGDVPEWWATTLRELVMPRPRSAPVDRPLVEEIVTYVVAGGSAPVLGHAFYGLRFSILEPDATDLAQRLYSEPRAVCPHVWARWAHVVAMLTWGGSWLEALVVHLHATLGSESKTPYAITTLAEIAAGNGIDFDEFVEQLWRKTPAHPYWGHGQKSLPTFAGYDHLVGRLRGRLAPALSADDLDVRIQATTLLGSVQDSTLATYGPELVAAAVSGSAKVRRAAAPLVARAGSGALDSLWDVATTAAADTRGHALTLLWDLTEDEAQRDRVRTAAEIDRSTKVRELVSSFDSRASADRTWPGQPVSLEPQWQIPATDALRSTVRAFVNESPHRDAQGVPQYLSLTSGVGDEKGLATAEQVSEELVTAVTASAPCTTLVAERIHWWHGSSSIQDAIVESVLTPEAALQLLVATDELDSTSYDGYRELTWTAGLLNRHQGMTLLDLAAMLDGLGRDGTQRICDAWFHPSPTALGREWDPADVWTFFAIRLDAVLELWQAKRLGSTYGFDTEALFLALRTLPSLPADVVQMCFDIALGAAKSDRRAAQDMLSAHEQATARAVAALTDGSAAVRAVAAEWLGRLGDRSAVPALATRQQQEKNETTQGVMLEALVALGERVADHLDLASLDVTAAKAMAKGSPAVTSGLGLDQLPPVHRADDGRTVPGTTLQWLVVRAVSTKSSAPGAVLTACLEQVAEPDRRQFGDALLDRWIVGDEVTLGQTAAIESAKWGGPRVDVKPTGAATRGALALVAACGGPRSVGAAARYIRTWHGQRATQSKALITMLAHHRDPSAAEVLVAIAYRFKAPSIERLAREEVAAIAERRGWSLDELADRTVATAGFGEDGRLVLSYGERRLVARLTPEIDIELSDEAGKVLTTLPAARVGEAADTVKQAKSALGAARKQLKETVAQQTARLEDAMVVRRTWTASAWWRDIAGHPVMARLAGRLVWLAEGADRQTFRLLEDGTLTDADDEPLAVGDQDRISVAHDVALTDEEIAAWQQHLTDYEVPLLFSQLGRGRAALSAEAAASDLLRGPAEEQQVSGLDRACRKRGYRRGAVGDGAVYEWFEKSFDVLGIQVRIGLENGVDISDPESRVRVDGLRFLDLVGNRFLPLGEVPSVLLVEARHDLALFIGSPL